MSCTSKHIPEDLAADILSRLPTKDVLRLRCVSKSWNKLIDSRYFVFMHYNLRNNCTRCIFFSKRVSSLYTLRFNDSEDFELCQHRMRFPENTNALRFCNGLFLLGNSESINRYAIWNPSTREYKELPKSPMSKHTSHNFHTCGFCYDSVNDDHKVVLVYSIYNHYASRVYSAFGVYSLKSNSWCLHKQDYQTCLFLSDEHAFVGGALHWVVPWPRENGTFKWNIPSKKGTFKWNILSFDVITGETKAMPTPDYGPHRTLPLVGEFEGCLCLSTRGSGLADLWLMKDYGVEESWIKLFSMPKLYAICPLAYSKCSTKIYFTNGSGEFLLHDLTTKTMGVIRHSEVSVPECPYNSVENLVRLRDYGVLNSRMPHGQEEFKHQRKERFGNMFKDLVCFSYDLVNSP